MIGIENLGAFIIAGILLNLTPGVNTMFILARSITNGKRAGVLSDFGINAESIIHTILAAFGILLIIAESGLVFIIVKYAGAVYLIYLGIKAILFNQKEFKMTYSDQIINSKRIFIQMP